MNEENLELFKECDNCYNIQPITEFRTNKLTKKRSNVCRLCVNLRSKLCKKKKKLSKTTKKCKICFQIKLIKDFQYNRKKCRECYKKENTKNRKEYYYKNRKEILRKKQKNAHFTIVNHLLNSAKARAKKYDIPFDLELENVVIPEYCPVLNIKLKRGNRKTLPNSPTLDRIVPKLGYIKNNVCVISFRANTLKSNGTIEEHQRIIEYMKKMLRTNN